MEGALITTLSYSLNKVIINGMEAEIIVYGCQLLFTLKMAEPIVPLECFSLYHQQFFFFFFYIITSNSFDSIADLTSENGTKSSKRSSSPGCLDSCPW